MKRAVEEKELEKEKQETEASEEKEAKASETDKETEKSEDAGKKEKAPEKKKDPKDEKIDELNDKLKRSMAEFDNYRKRTDKEKSAMYEIGAKDVIEKILPIVDNFERGLAAVPEEEKDAILEEFDKAQMETKVLSRGANPPMLHSKIDKATARFVPAFAI